MEAVSVIDLWNGVPSMTSPLAIDSHARLLDMASPLKVNPPTGLIVTTFGIANSRMKEPHAPKSKES